MNNFIKLLNIDSQSYTSLVNNMIHVKIVVHISLGGT